MEILLSRKANETILTKALISYLFPGNTREISLRSGETSCGGVATCSLSTTECITTTIGMTADWFLSTNPVFLCSPKSFTHSYY